MRTLVHVARLIASTFIAAAVFAGPVLAATPVSPSPAASPGPIPAELRNTWLASPLTVTGLDTSADIARVFELSSAGIFQLLRYGDHHFPGRLLSGARIAPDGRLQLTTAVAADGCQVGDVGLYAWSIAGPDQRLTIEAGTDGCATRGAVVPGSWAGLGTGCNEGQWCIGSLEPGSHSTALFTPRGAGGSGAKAGLDSLTYTVPEGWANTLDDPNGYVLTPVAASQQGSGVPNVALDGVYVFARPAALITDTGCPGKADPSVGRSLDDLVAFVEGNPALVVHDSKPVTIGGRAGLLLDIDIAPAWTATCPDWPGSGPFVPLFADGAMLNKDLTIGDSWQAGSGGVVGFTNDPMRILLLDIGGGNTVFAVIDTYDPATEPAFVEQAMPILESLRFAD